jgi:hypothetical protein
MKFIHLLAVIGVSAGLAVATRTPHRALATSGAEPGDPPWLTGAWSPEATPEAEPHAHMDDSEDPHAGMYEDTMYEDTEDPHAGIDPSVEPAAVAAPTGPVSPSRAPNGKTVAMIFADRQHDAGQTVRVRGTVVKLTEGVLGKNYLHLWDGSGGSDAPADLTVTSVEPFTIGETVEVEGQLAIDQDVGAGYRYDALLVDAHRIEN